MKYANMFSVLDEKLLTVLWDLFRNAMLPDRPPQLTLELYLVALHSRFGEETDRFFENPAMFEEFAKKQYAGGAGMVANMRPEELEALMQDRLRKAASAEALQSTPGRRPALDIPLDLALTIVLSDAAQAATAEGRTKAEISDVIKSFSKHLDFVDRVRKATGLVLKR